MAFPFGYGLSYTDFAYSNMNVAYNEQMDQFEVRVTVTNTGDTYSGKETLQVYSQSPYTQYDIDNKVEKASVALCGFGKTDILAPGESQETDHYPWTEEIWLPMTPTAPAPTFWTRAITT